MEIIETLEKINEFLNQSFVFRSIKLLLGFYMTIIILVIIGIIFRIGKSYLVILFSGQEFPTIARGKYQKKWDEIESLMQTDDQKNWKIAILKSAQLLEEVLKTLQYSGDTLGERLNGMVEIQLRNLEEVKNANKIKNRIVQDDVFEISKNEAQKIVEIFGNALRFFEVIN